MSPKSSISSHVRISYRFYQFVTTRYTTDFYIIKNSKKRDQSLLTFLRRKDEEDNPKGETLPEDMRLFRFDLVEAFLSAGIPLSKIDHLRSFLEKYGQRLTAHGHLSQMIPSIIEKEKETLKTESHS